MPELAEVEYYRKVWNPGLGHTVRRVELHPQARVFRETSASLIRRRLTGACFEKSFAHGKNLLFAFSDGGWLGGHLGMTGELRVEGADFQAGRHDHLVLGFDGMALVFSDPRMFGRIRFEVSPGGPPDWWRELPPEVLSDGFTRGGVADFLRRHRKSPLKTLLLDQSAFPGIGNWMADEICWRQRWHPARLAGGLSGEEAVALWKRIREVAGDAMRVIGRDWGEPPDSWLFNHRWDRDHRCPRRGCGAMLVRDTLRGRTTCHCPNCQPVTGPESA